MAKGEHQIVVLDGFALNPGDLNWDEMEALGRVTVYDRTTPELVGARIEGAEIVLTNKTVLTRDVLAGSPSLRYVGVLATGYNVVDLGAAAEQGITVTNIPSYSTASVAQFTLAMILELCHRIGHHHDSVMRGDWARSLDFSYWHYPMLELTNRTLGIVGFGRIGQAVARLAVAFGMRVLVYNRTPKPELMTEGCRQVDWETLLAESDIVTLHCPLTQDNRGLMNRATFAQMKPGAFLINAARGPLVAEADLCEALNRGQLAGAAVDVVATEPIKPDNPLLQAKNIIITPHIAWASQESRRRLMTIAAENIKAYLTGQPINVVEIDQ